MFKKLLGLVGLASMVAMSPALAQPHVSAVAPQAREIYELLFCDKVELFRPKSLEQGADWQQLLFGDAPDPSRIKALASDVTQEARIRALAFNWLRLHGQPTPKRVILGVIVEMPLVGGLDVLAAYADGSVRYINQSGRMAFIEPDSEAKTNRTAKKLVALAEPIVAQIGPSEHGRLPPPEQPSARITFVVSDGLHFGEGRFEDLAGDKLAGPLMRSAVSLLQQTMAAASKDD